MCATHTQTVTQGNPWDFSYLWMVCKIISKNIVEMRIAIYTNEDRANQLRIVHLNSQSMKTNNFIECKTKTDLLLKK